MIENIRNCLRAAINHSGPSGPQSHAPDAAADAGKSAAVSAISTAGSMRDNEAAVGVASKDEDEEEEEEDEGVAGMFKMPPPLPPMLE
jgi:hypothetical protein